MSLPEISAWAHGKSVFLYGQYKKIKNEHTGVLTGKGLTYGGSLVRKRGNRLWPFVFTEEMLKT